VEPRNAKDNMGSEYAADHLQKTVETFPNNRSQLKLYGAELSHLWPKRGGGFSRGQVSQPLLRSPIAGRRLQEHSPATATNRNEQDFEALSSTTQQLIEHARAGFLVIVLALAAIVIIIYGLKP